LELSAARLLRNCTLEWLCLRCLDIPLRKSKILFSRESHYESASSQQDD